MSGDKGKGYACGRTQHCEHDVKHELSFRCESLESLSQEMNKPIGD